MEINIVSEVDLEAVYALGYELIEKQMKGSSLTESELSFINFVYNKVDGQIMHLLNSISIH